MIAIPSFSKTYAGRCVLDFPGSTLEAGEVCCVIGANGSGKSTFAKILAGTLAADQRGKVFSGSVGFMPQKSFAFRMSTRANLMLKNQDAARAEKLMEIFRLTPLAAKRADRLSGGETSRMALARLMMNRYDLVILDEPTAAMDMEMTLIAEREIRRYAAETGCALILVTHSLRQTQRMADSVLFFRDGKLYESGAAEMLDFPQNEETRKFLDFYGV